jgi:hypothetical protein
MLAKRAFQQLTELLKRLSKVGGEQVLAATGAYAPQAVAEYWAARVELERFCP